MLCQLRGIQNMDAEKQSAEAALAKHSHLGATLYCMQVAPCLYAQANVKWDKDAEYNFKMCGPLDQILALRLLNTIIRDKKIQAIITDDSSLILLLRNHFVPRAYAGLLHLCAPTCGAGCKVDGLGRKSIWTGLLGGR
jgi:hypothetical protein